MTKDKDDNQFFNSLKSKMKNNADKMKGDNKVEKDKPKDKEEIKDKKVEKVEDKKSKKKTKVKKKAENVKLENKNDEEIRRTYYLRNSVVKEIDGFAKRTGNNKSYLVELALTYYLEEDNLKQKLLKEDSTGLKINTDKLVIPNKKDQKKVRRTYYLKESIVEKLDLVAKETDKDKSFVVDKALKFLFENAEIE